MKLSLRIKLLILLLAISLVPLLSFSQFLSEKSMNEIRSKTENAIKNLTEAKAKDYNKQFKKLENEINVASQEIGKKWNSNPSKANLSYIWIAPYGDDYQKHEDELKNFENIMEIINGIYDRNKDSISLAYFGTEKGVAFLSDSKLVNKLREIGKFDHRERKWYVEAKNKKKNIWTEYIDVNTGDVTLSNSQPVFDKNDNFIGVVSLDLPLHTIKNDILDIKFEEKGYAIIVDRDGNIIVHPNYTAGNKKWNESFKEMNILNISGLASLYNEIKNGGQGIKKINISSSYYAAFYPLPEINGSLVFLLPENVITKSIYHIQSLLWFVAFILSAIVITISIFFSLGITKPVEKLKKATGEIAKGNLDYTVDISSKDEIGELANNFNEMVKKLQKIKKSLEESEKKYRDIFEYSQDAIYISTIDGKLLDINKAGEDLFGYSRDELLNMNVENLYANKEDREKFKKEISKRGFVRNYEVKLRKKDGKEIDCLLSTIMFKKGDKIIYQGIIKDITPIKEARKELDTYNSLLRHDIGNRLQIALASIELAREEKISDDIKGLIEKAFENLVAIKDLLMKLRMISIAYERNLKRIDLNNVISESIGYFKEIANEKGIKINYEEGDGIVLANDLLINIFSNIIENSIKHSGCKNIYIKTRKENGYYVVEIEDDGNGIPDEIRDKIFELGVKGKESNGSGLGLHLVKKIVEIYGGKVNLESGKEGTKFEIYLRKFHL